MAMSEEQTSALYSVYFNTFDRANFRKQHPDNEVGFREATVMCQTAQEAALRLEIPESLIGRAMKQAEKDIRDGRTARGATSFGREIS